MFWESGYSDAQAPLNAWWKIMSKETYRTPQEVKDQFSSASFLADNRVVFNIGGNKYRLVVAMRYERGKVYVKKVLTHTEYDKQSKAGTL